MSTLNQNKISERVELLVHGYIRKASKMVNTIIPLSIIELCMLFLQHIDSISIKVTCIGDVTIGKTCMIMTHVFQEFPKEYIPLVYSHQDYDQDITLLCDGYQFKITWQDTGHGDYDERIHIEHHYPLTDVLLICFSIISRHSLQRVKEKWMKHREKYMSHAPFILIGTKTDLRYDPNVIQKLGTSITDQEGHELANQIGADQYMECSSYKKQGLHEIMKAVCKLYIKEKWLHSQSKKKKDFHNSTFLVRMPWLKQSVS